MRRTPYQLRKTRASTAYIVCTRMATSQRQVCALCLIYTVRVIYCALSTGQADAQATPRVSGVSYLPTFFNPREQSCASRTYPGMFTSWPANKSAPTVQFHPGCLWKTVWTDAPTSAEGLSRTMAEVWEQTNSVMSLMDSHRTQSLVTALEEKRKHHDNHSVVFCQ